MASSDFRSALHHFPGASGYRLRRSRAPQAGNLGPHRHGPRRISPVQRWAVWSFRSHYAGGFLGAAAPSSSHRPWPSPSRSGLGSRSFLPSQACLRRVHRLPHRTDRPLARRPRRLCHDASTLGSPLAPATSYGAAWPLPRPDFHRQVHRRLQDTHRDTKFSRAFDAIFRSDGIKVIRTPVRAPNANAHIERWVGTVRRECLDRLLIFNRRQLEKILRVYVRHYNRLRPHRALALQAPDPPGMPPADALLRDQRSRFEDATCSAD